MSDPYRTPGKPGVEPAKLAEAVVIYADASRRVVRSSSGNCYILEEFRTSTDSMGQKTGYWAQEATVMSQAYWNQRAIERKRHDELSYLQPDDQEREHDERHSRWLIETLAGLVGR